MQRTSKVARTAPDLDHLNRLRFPDFRIPALYFEIGSKRSKTHHPQGLVVADADTGGSDAFNFAPEKEVIEICYTVYDPFAVATGGTLALFTEFDEQPLWSLDLAVLGADWFSHGKHRVKWDGRVFESSAAVAGNLDGDTVKHDLTASALAPDKSLHADFPDGYVSIEHAPYKLRLSLTNASAAELKDRPTYAWTFSHILLHGIELELGVEAMIPAATVGDPEHELNKALLATLAMPAEGGTQKVKLKMNVFPTALGEFHGDVSHDEFKNAWGDGPSIPIVAKLRLADSTGAEVKLDESDKGAVALGKARFIWDWESTDQASPEAFITNALDFNKDSQTSATASDKDHYPPSDNCHAERGGKRGEAGQPVFPEQAGYDPKAAPLTVGAFPFAVEAWKTDATKKRLWASASQAWTREALKGKTGAVFQPSRMAGDNYTLTVYLAYAKRRVASGQPVEWTLDVTDTPLKAPAAVMKKSGQFVVWHTMDFTRSVHKDGVPAPLMPGIIGAVNGLLDSSFRELVDESAGQQYAVSAHVTPGGAFDYDARCKALLDLRGEAVITQRYAVDDAFDHSATPSLVQTRPYEDFVHKVFMDECGGDPADIAHYTANDLCDLAAADLGPAGWDVDSLGPGPAACLRATQAWLNTNGFGDYQLYRERLADIAFDIVDDLCSEIQFVDGGNGGGAAAEGVMVFEVDFLHSYERVCWDNGWTGGNFWYGQGEFVADTTRNKGMIFMCAQIGSDDYNFTHELGHLMFLCHAPAAPTSAVAGGFDDTVHDNSNLNCLMTYDAVRPGFCAFCQLKLRGWLPSSLSNDPTANNKP